MIYFFWFFFTLFLFPLYGEMDLDKFQELLSLGIKIDLASPTYKDGVLETSEGGRIQGKNLFIEAKNIRFTHDKETSTTFVEASKDVFFEYQDTVFVGDLLVYNFTTNEGTLFKGTSELTPWYFGGDTLEIFNDGTIKISKGFLSTSENFPMDWYIYSDCTTLKENKDFIAEGVRFRYFNTTLFRLPTLKANLDFIFDSPIRYSFKWGGKQGPRFGMIYEIFSWNQWKTFLHLDYRITRGPGAGFEAQYKSLDKKEWFHTINYVADDSSLIQPKESVRYRFLGNYHNEWPTQNLKFHLSYDKLSDRDMATDYDDRELEIAAAKRTELVLTKTEENWIGAILTRARINYFQTLNQEVPTFKAFFRPQAITPFQILSESRVKASFLDFEYSNSDINVENYDSSRFLINQKFYKNLGTKGFSFIPKIEFLGIYYGNSPSSSPEWLAAGLFTLESRSKFYRRFAKVKHTIEPYVEYQYLTYPTSNPHEHYIFDIDDGIYRLNQLQVGINQEIFTYKKWVERPLELDIYTNIFFDTKTLHPNIPKMYLNFSSLSLPNLKHSLEWGFDFDTGDIDHFNFLNAWTLNENFAVKLEYRKRSSLDYRKVDHTNYILDSYRSQFELEHSQVADRRETFLFHLFYRFHDNLALEVSSRTGWGRKHEPSYNEFAVDFIGSFQACWEWKLNLQKREEESRVALYISMKYFGLPSEEERKRPPLLAF